MSLNEDTEDSLGFSVNSTDIPGGIFQCLYNAPLTIMNMSESFLHMFGYSREDIRARFHDSFWEMIDPRDREPVIEEVKRQLKISTRKEIQYRIICSNGKSMWVLDKGQLVVDSLGRELFCCILIDITETKKIQEELKYTLERYQIIMSQTNDVIFEWNIDEKHFTVSTNVEKHLGYRPVVRSIDEGAFLQSHVYPEDVAAFTGALDKIRGGSAYQELEIRIIRRNKEFGWYRTRITTQYDDSGRPSRAVGVFMDINSEKEKAKKLKERAERDSLTKLYNKGTAQSLIEKHISRSAADEQCGVMIFDIDNFKLVNDTMGHMFGDAFLIEVTNKVQKLFRSQDIVGRIGGDEFIVFMKDIAGADAVVEKAEKIIKAFYELAILDNTKLHISCSVGIALFPRHGDHFKDLYRKADNALYQAKRQGKNQYVIYDEELGSTYIDMPQEIFTAVNEKIDSNDNGNNSINMKIIAYVFRILYQSMDIEAAVKSILEIVGLQYDVSRAYIFENTEDNKYCSNTFEWCNEGVEPEMDYLQKVSYERDLDNYLDNFDENGIFYCRDVKELAPKQRAILEPQGIKSILQCAIMDNGMVKGYVGFDECRVNRFWTQEQIGALNFISEILSTFLLKKRAQDRLTQEAEALHTVLDNQSSWIYVIDLDTYRMLFINRKTRELVPDAREGMTCYEAFYNSGLPCEQCPARKMTEDGTRNCMLEIHNENLKVWVSADASLVSWRGKDACLLTCHDVTRYNENI